jgi:hypothetical protein
LHRIASPVLQRLELEEPRIDEPPRNLAIHPLIRGERADLDRVEARLEPMEISDLVVDSGLPKVFKPIVVRVKSVAGGYGWMMQCERIKILIDERGKRERRRRGRLKHCQ